MRSFFNFLLGVVSGAVVGAAAGLLLAPGSGEQIREGFQNRADMLLSDVRTAIADERRRLEAELEALKRGELQVD
jgi:gas vesicle protein